MKPNNVLLLNLDPAGELGSRLRRILESASNPNMLLHQETISSDQYPHLTDRIPEIFSRRNPALIFLVSAWNSLKHARSLIPSLRHEKPEPPLIVVSDTEAPDEMFEMIKLGAADFIIPPLTPAGILPRLWRLLDQTCWGEALVEKLKEKFNRPRGLIGESQAFLEAINKVALVAKCDASIMISGETGTGKDLFAKGIHQLSLRANGPFVPVNCGAIPPELVENELFGHERGAFTGATDSRPGLIEEADGGTLFLDEIDCLPLLSQVKLLRFLQEKEYRPLGSTITRQADLRVVTATNVDVEKAVRDGKLRQDLYYRLNMIPIVLPPLRERREDIMLLATNFMVKYATEFKKKTTCFSQDALQKLLLYDWPGNVRELEHVIGRAVALSEQRMIRESDIVLPSSEANANQESFRQIKAKIIAQFERTYLQGLLLAHQGNITKAAQAAQKDRGAFWHLLRKHQIDVKRFRQKLLEDRDNSRSVI
jgi:two-component system, NtrC family, response regulator GlrR